MADQLVSQPDHGEQIILERGLASDRLQVFFDDITRLVNGFAAGDGGGTISPDDYLPNSFLYKPSTGLTLENATINELEIVGRLQGGQIEGLNFAEVWSILGNGTGNITINDPGFARTFTIESDASANMFVVDGGQDRVGISPTGNLPSDGVLHVLRGEIAGFTASPQADLLVLESTGAAGMTIKGDVNFPAVIAMGTDEVETWRDGWESIIKLGKDANIAHFQNTQGFSLNCNLYEQAGVSGELWTYKETGPALELVLQPNNTIFYQYGSGAGGTIVARQTNSNKISFSRGSAIFNDFELPDVDFFIYGANNTGLFVADALGNRMGIAHQNLQPTDGLLHLQKASAGSVTASGEFDHIVIEDDGQCGITLLGGDETFMGLVAGSAISGNFDGAIVYKCNSDTLGLGRWSFRTGGNINRFYVDDGAVAVNPEFGFQTCDFRVNGFSTGADLFYVNTANGANRVSMSNAGVTGTDGILHIIEGGLAGSVSAPAAGDTLVLESNDDAGMSLICSNTGDATIYFGNPAALPAFNYLKWLGASEILFFTVGNTNVIRMQNTGGGFDGVWINAAATANIDFRVSGDTSSYLFFTDAGADRAGFSDASVAPTDGVLHIHEAGSAGTVTAHADADTLVLESSADAGLSILVPNDGSTANIYFGAPTSGNNVGRVSMVPSTGVMTITADQVNHSNNIGFAGRLDANVTTVTGTSHTAGDEHVILVDDDTAGSAVTITLPTAATADTIYHIKKLGSTANVIVDGNGAETIDGGTTATLTTQYESITIISDGSAWWVL